MTERYQCATKLRRNVVSAKAGWNGIDYLEVTPTTDVNVAVKLRVVLLKLDGIAALGAANVRIEGGLRYPAPAIEGPVVPEAVGSRVLVVTLRPPVLTDFSTYRLRLTDDTGAAFPPNFDPQLCAVDFSFKVNCPTPFDCRTTARAPVEPQPAEPDFDYGARDWQSFRQLMMDRLAALLPNVAADTPVDFLATQVETLASVADQLSYRLDAIFTERTIGTARSRISLARHARLLDYTVHEGCNARCFVKLDYVPGGAAPATVDLPAGLPITTARPGSGPTVLTDEFARWLPQMPVVFETSHPVTLCEGNNTLDFYTWSNQRCLLPQGATGATFSLRRAPGAPAALLAAGDFLLLYRTVDPVTGARINDRRYRHIVRLTSAAPDRDPIEGVDVIEVGWALADALPFDLVLSAEISIAGAPAALNTCAQAAANLVLADHGVTLPPGGVAASTAAALAPTLIPPSAPEEGPWRPRLSRTDLVRLVPLDPSTSDLLSVQAVRNLDPAAALPALALRDRFSTWRPRASLLASQRFDRDVVVETEYDESIALRFGDNVMGLQPAPGTGLDVAGRFGRREDGMIGADVLGIAVTSQRGIVGVGNPLPAFGAADPVAASVVRIEAPQAFRAQERAVTESDYAVAAERFPGVQNAVARVRWTGAWRTAFVYIDRDDGLPVDSDAGFMADLSAHLDRYRLAGGDIAIRGAIPVPLDLALRVCVCQGVLRADVELRLFDRLGAGTRANATRGFFHPDNFTFGTPLYLSALLKAALEVPGVSSVEAIRFQRWAKPSSGELAAAVIAAGDLEVLRLANDPDFPENGRLFIDLLGGL